MNDRKFLSDNIKAVILDFDGTVGNSRGLIVRTMQQTIRRLGLPERTETPSDEWCQTVKVELVKQSMTVNELAKQLDVSRDRLSLVINGKMMNEAIVSGVNNLFGINLVAVPADK